jgi:hypothetical protein
LPGRHIREWNYSSTLAVSLPAKLPLLLTKQDAGQTIELVWTFYRENSLAAGRK